MQIALPVSPVPAVVKATSRFPWRFLLITFSISWICWLLLALSGRNGFNDLEAGVLLVLGGFGPALGAIVLITRSEDSAAASEYWRRVFEFRRIRLAWLPVLLLYPAVVIVSFVLTGTALDFSPLQTLLSNPADLAITLVFVFIFGPFSEELGWRGYALDWLQTHFSAFWASVHLGVIWWAWHLPLLFVPGAFLNTTGTDVVFLAGYLGTVVLYSVLFTWVYNNNRSSILAAILLHFSINLTSRLIAIPAAVFPIVTVILIGIMLVVVWAFGGKHLVRSA